MALISCRPRVSGGISWAETGTQWNATSSVASAIRAISRTSCRQDVRRFAGVDIEHLHTAAIRADKDMIAIQRQILLRIAGCQRVYWRAGLQSLFNEFRLWHARSFSHGPPRRHDLAQISRARFEGKPHTNLFNDPQRGIVDFFYFLQVSEFPSCSFGLVMDLMFFDMGLSPDLHGHNKEREGLSGSFAYPGLSVIFSQAAPTRFLATLTAPMASSE